MFESIFCKHNNTRIEIDTKSLVCNHCLASWPIPEELTIASGVFQRIDQRIEQEQEYARLVRLGESYLADRNFFRE